VALRTGLAAGVRFRKERLMLLLLWCHYVGMGHLRGADERKERGPAVRLDASVLAAAIDEGGWHGASRCPSCSAPASDARPEFHPRNQTYTKYPPNRLIRLLSPARASRTRIAQWLANPVPRCSLLRIPSDPWLQHVIESSGDRHDDLR